MKTTQELKELLYKNKTVADQQPDAIAEANAFCEGYKAFLNAAKTEREAAAYSEQLTGWFHIFYYKAFHDKTKGAAPWYRNWNG